MNASNSLSNAHANTIYISATGKQGTYQQWHKEAIVFYRSCETVIPNDWFERWTKVLKLTACEVPQASIVDTH